MKSMMSSVLTVALVAVFSITACKKNVKLNSEDNKVSKAGVVSVSSSELKIKGKKFDVMLSVTNEAKVGTIILLNEMTCAQGQTPGMLKHTFFGIGERTINFTPGQTKKFRLVCDLGEKATGDYSVTIAKVYANPTGDGKTTEKVLADSIVWKTAVDASK